MCDTDVTGCDICSKEGANFDVGVKKCIVDGGNNGGGGLDVGEISG